MGLLEGRRALVTGGASGIGLATVRRLVAEGATVCLLDVDPLAADRAASETGASFVQADVSDPAQVRDAFEDTAGRLGSLDLVHLNAGVLTGEPDITLVDDAAYRRTTGVNIDGVAFGVREAARIMRESGGGSIVATASIAGLTSMDSDPVYTMTKHAVIGLVRSLAPQLQPHGITINCVCPGIVETPMLGEVNADSLRQAGFPLIQPDQIADAVVHAVTEGGTGNAWVCQPGREHLAFRFGGVPGPRVPGAEGMAPPTLV
ncbi:MAG TPA: SDR family oxidoreductase [Actinomycetota bacterium]|nr:SDR family oxidoreductase [Actinomycetota bacterium]